jgi:hypothetical protein
MRLGRVFLLLAFVLLLSKLWLINRERHAKLRQQAASNGRCMSPQEMQGYDRKALFGTWIDADRDCRNSRAEILEHSSFAPTDNGCTIHEGKWFDPYTGDTLTRAGDLDIDHIVPLKEAWLSGAFAWTREERESFANDPEVLLAVGKHENRAKSDKDPARWLPPNTDFQLEYASRWARIKLRFRLSADAAELDALKSLGVTQLPSLAEAGCSAP